MRTFVLDGGEETLHLLAALARPQPEVRGEDAQRAARMGRYVHVDRAAGLESVHGQVEMGDALERMPRQDGVAEFGAPPLEERPARVVVAGGVLELDEGQVAASRRVLHDYGNMSSATLPHIWMRLLADPDVPRGTLIPSFAFGPGLSVCGALLEKQ